MLKFNVRNQSISRIDNFKPAEKSIKYLYASFDFKTDDWNDVNKTAVFKNNKTGKAYDVIVENNECIVPWEALSESGTCKVSVYGVKKDGSKITTDTESFNLNKTIYGGSGTEEPSPSVYEMLLLGIDELEDKVNDINDKIENFNPGTGGGGDIDLSGYATKEEVDELSQDINDLNDDLAELGSLVRNDFNLSPNKYIDFRYGTENPYGSDWLFVTDFILIKDYCDLLGIVGINYAEDNVAGISFYDSNKQYLGGEKLYNLPNKITIPNNAKFLRSTVPKGCITSYGFAFIDSVEKFNAHNKSVDDEIHVLAYNINDTTEKINAIADTKTVSDIVTKIIKGKINIKLIGDSITHGVGGTGFAQDGAFIGNFFGNDYYRNPNGYCWANLFKEYIESKFECTVTNNAVIGTSFIELDNRFDTLVSDEDNVIICAYGTNNRESLADITVRLKNCIEKIREKGIDVIFLTPIPALASDEVAHTAHIEDVCNAIKSVFISENVPYVDVNQAILDYCDYRMVSIETLLADGLHPNDNGHEVMFKSICKGLGITRKVDGATW